jgi:tetratricopeptide (TPR) repeat protein
VWRRRGKAASAAALYSVYHGLYSEAVVSSITSAIALAEAGQFKEAVEYVQKAAKALYEVAREVFERVKVTVQHLIELFVEAVTRMLAWIDEHKAYLFLMAAAAASLTPFIPAGVKEYSREEVVKMLKETPDPYEKFKEIVEVANVGGMKLAEPWESLRVLIMPKRSEERRLMHRGGAEQYSKYREDERMKKALFYATFALEEAFGIYRSALKEIAEERVKAMEEVEVARGRLSELCTWRTSAA